MSEPRDQWLVDKLIQLRVHYDTPYDGMWDTGSVGAALGALQPEPSDNDTAVASQGDWVRLKDVLDALGLSGEDFKKRGKR